MDSLKGVPSTWGLSQKEFFTICLLTSYIIIYILSRRGKNKNVSKSGKISLRNIPGPTNIPFIGGIYPLIGRKRDIFQKVVYYGKKYGAIISFEVLHRQIIVLNSAEFVKKLLTSTSPGHLKKPAELYKIPLGETYLGNGLFTSYGDTWRSHRKVVGRVFTQKWNQIYMRIFNKHARRLVADLGKIEDNNLQAAVHIIQQSSFKMVTEAVFGEADEESASNFCKWTERRNEMLSFRIAVPIFLHSFFWRLHPNSWEFDLLEKKLNAIALRLIDKSRIRKQIREESGEELENKTMIDEFLSSNFSDSDILYECNTVIVAGFDTTTWTAIHCLYFLATHPAIQAECRKEIDRIFQDEKCQNEELTLDNVADMEMVDRCIKETLRLVPAFFIMLRELDVNLKLNEYIELPAGTTVGMSSLLLHNNEEYFPEPDKFDPDRFLPENVAKRPSHSYIPFSMGMRGCIGITFAMLEIKTIVAHVLSNYVISTEDKFGEIRMIPNHVIKPEKEYRLKFTKREDRN